MRIRLASALLLIVPIAAMAQRVSGTVRATGTRSPMSDATIALLDSVGAAIAQGQSDANGRYDIQLPPDARQIRATHIGYRPVVLAIPRGSGDVALDVIMDVLRELDTVTTKAPEQRYQTPRLQEFERRRKTGIGRFISEDEMKKHEHAALSDFLTAYVPGVKLISDGGRMFLSANSSPFMNARTSVRSNGPAGCWATVYLDGMVIFEGGPPPPGLREYTPPDLRQFFALNLSGVEYYTGANVPLQFKSTRNPCGTLVLWTRGK